jgi:hypothetical protein
LIEVVIEVVKVVCMFRKESGMRGDEGDYI